MPRRDTDRNLLFGIMAKTPFEELNNSPFLIATTLGTMSAFVLALFAGRLIGRLPLRDGTVRAAMGGDRGIDGVAATGAEYVRDREAK